MTGSGSSIVAKVLESQTLGFDNHVTLHRVWSYFSIFKGILTSSITWASRIKISDILQDLDFISEPSHYTQVYEWFVFWDFVGSLFL